MANKLYDETSVQNIANAIREKNGSTSTYTIGEMSQAINNLNTTGDGTDISLNITGATVGQTVKISAVDVNGVPTAWVPVNMGSGEKWEKIAEIVIPDGAAETNALTINKDINRDPFRLIKARLCVKQPKYTGDSRIPGFYFAMINGKTTGRITPNCIYECIPDAKQDPYNRVSL